MKETVHRSPPHKCKLKATNQQPVVAAPVADTQLSMRLSMVLVSNYLARQGLVQSLGCWISSDVAVPNIEHIPLKLSLILSIDSGFYSREDVGVSLIMHLSTTKTH